LSSFTSSLILWRAHVGTIHQLLLPVDDNLLAALEGCVGDHAVGVDGEVYVHGNRVDMLGWLFLPSGGLSRCARGAFRAGVRRGGGCRAATRTLASAAMASAGSRGDILQLLRWGRAGVDRVDEVTLGAARDGRRRYNDGVLALAQDQR